MWVSSLGLTNVRFGRFGLYVPAQHAWEVSSTRQEQAAITVFSQNIRSGLSKGVPLASVPDRAALKETGKTIGEKKPDVVVLNEVVRRPDLDVLGVLAKAAGMQLVWAPTLEITPDRSARRPRHVNGILQPATPGWVQFGNALLVPKNLRQLDVAAAQLPSLGEYNPNNNPGLHEPRNIVVAAMEFSDGRRARVAATHLSPLRADDDYLTTRRENEAQLRQAFTNAFRLPTFVERSDAGPSQYTLDYPTIVAGDFNTRINERTILFDGTPAEMAADAGFRWAVTGATHLRHGVTVDAQFFSPGGCADNSDLTVTECEVDKTMPIGDHAAITQTYALSNEIVRQRPMAVTLS